MKNFRIGRLSALLLPCLFLLQACGSGGEPFSMDVRSDLIIGDAGPVAQSFLVNPVLEEAVGSMGAEVLDEFNDRLELDVFDLNATAVFPDLGDINLILDPNFPSSLTVYKLNRNNQPFGTNTMLLSLIIETPEQNLTLSNLTLSSNSAALMLDQDLPPLTFFFQGQAKELDLSTFQVQIPASLIQSDFDPQ